MTVWVDASSGASGDMLLGALAGAGVPVDALQDAIDRVAPEPVSLRVERVIRNGFAATRCHVEVADSSEHRSWADIQKMLADSALDQEVRAIALRVFARLAEAEAKVHGREAADVTFHEVGALDAIVDVVGACAGLEHLALDVLVVSPVAVGGGHVGTEHGRLPVPAPAVAELLRGLPSYGGPVDLELCTPTGAALLVANATGTGGQPAMTTTAIGLGAGGHDPAGHTNALRLLVGVSTGSTTGAARPPGARCWWRPTSTTSTRDSGRSRSRRSWRPGPATPG